MDTKTLIKEKAREIGFDLVGITVLAPSKYREMYENWLKHGMHADMDYLKRTNEVRLSPLLKFSWAKSIVMVGVNYYQGPLPDLKKGEVRISRYAIARDYHLVLSEMLKELSFFITSKTKSRRTKYYTDTGPIMEKELAERAGLGWIGKNTLLITEEFGSWVFLGEILLDIILKPDKASIDRCGDCKLCLDSCPTNAIIKPHCLNANLCTSYQTTENQRDLPDWFPSIGNPFIFGCDICQEVCPFNRNAKITNIKDFLPQKPLINPNIEYLGRLSRDKFKSIFRETPTEWTGWDIFTRNIRAFSKKAKRA